MPNFEGGGGIPPSEKGTADGVATLDGGGKVPATQIPAVALPEVHVVADAAARLALTVQEGDESIQTDTGEHYLFDGTVWKLYPGASAAPHALGGASHTADTLASLNTKVSDAILDDTSAARTPSLHTLGGAEHSASTLAALNALVSDATLDDSTANRTDADAVHDNVSGEIAAVAEKLVPLVADVVLIESAADANAKRRAQLGNLPGMVEAAKHDSLASTTLFSTTSATFVDAFAGGTISPPEDGDYFIFFEGEVTGTSGNTVVETAVGKNSTTVAESGSAREHDPSGSGVVTGSTSSLVLIGLVTTDDISGIIRKKSGGGSVETRNRRITMIRVTT